MRVAALAGFLVLAAISVFASADEASVRSADGVEIRYEVVGSGSPPIVFVHGWSCDRSYWRAQIDHFTRSHQVVAIDLAGHGRSGMNRSDWTMEAFGADVEAVLDALDLRGAVLVGHSMGGPVILEAAKLAPERVAALVPVDTLSDVGAPPSAEQIEAFVEKLRADFRTTTDAFVRGMFAPRSDPKLVDRIASDMSAAPPDVGISAVGHTWRYDAGAALAALEIPVRLINADKWPTDLEGARRQKPDLELAVMPASGHFLMMERPDEFNRLLERAVRELTSR